MKVKTKKRNDANWVNDYSSEQLNKIYDTIRHDYATQFLTIEERLYKIDK